MLKFGAMLDEAIGKRRRSGMLVQSESSDGEEKRAAVSDSRAMAPPEIAERDKKAAVTQPKKPRKKPKTEAEDPERIAYEIINDMKEIYKKDAKAHKEEVPAMMRLNSVDSIYQRVIKNSVQEACVKLGVLSEIKQWLEPMPDRSLPNQKVKKVLLGLLSNLRVHKSDLLNSGVGKIVHFYSRNPKEARDVRKMAVSLMGKWKARILKEETA